MIGQLKNWITISTAHHLPTTIGRPTAQSETYIRLSSISFDRILNLKHSTDQKTASCSSSSRFFPIPALNQIFIRLSTFNKLNFTALLFRSSCKLSMPTSPNPKKMQSSGYANVTPKGKNGSGYSNGLWRINAQHKHKRYSAVESVDCFNFKSDSLFLVRARKAVNLHA